jgi:hypothetical protein
LATTAIEERALADPLEALPLDAAAEVLVLAETSVDDLRRQDLQLTGRLAAAGSRTVATPRRGAGRGSGLACSAIAWASPALRRPSGG